MQLALVESYRANRCSVRLVHSLLNVHHLTLVLAVLPLDYRASVRAPQLLAYKTFRPVARAQNGDAAPATTCRTPRFTGPEVGIYLEELIGFVEKRLGSYEGSTMEPSLPRTRY